MGATAPSSPEPELSELEEALGHGFADPTLLERALTHRSAGAQHNERLEFLGDAILDGVIAVALYRRFPEASEGDLSRYRASLVRHDSLLRIAGMMQLCRFLRLGEGEQRNGGTHRPSIQADAVEALVGAVYLDGGPLLAEACVLRLFGEALDQIRPGEAVKDGKTHLQEILQGRRLPLPRYAVVSVSGEAHAQVFEAECVISSLGLRLTGRGGTRRAAEQDAAQKAVGALSTHSTGGRHA